MTVQRRFWVTDHLILPFPLSDFLSVGFSSLENTISFLMEQSTLILVCLHFPVYSNGFSPENLAGRQLAADGGVHTGWPPGYRVEECTVHVVGLMEESQHSLQEHPFSRAEMSS